MKAGLERRGEADAPAHVRLRVLIVEDSEEDALLLLRELRRGGYEPFHERVDTPEAMRQALEERGPWDVVLSDWRMPRFEAPEALAMFHATGSEAPFIIVSGKVGEELAVEGMKAGAHDYVMKDNLTRLCATVERGLEEAHARHERKRAEEERDHLFEFSLDLLCVASTDGYLKRVNPAFEETLGYSGEELLAKPFIEFVHPEDRVATMSELQSLGRGARTAYFENRYLRKDGSQVWLAWKAVPVLEKDLIYATARDVTERKRDEEELHRREAILRAVAFAAECFLKKAASWEESIEEGLERLGRAAEVSRVYVFENYRGEDGELWGTQRYEWVATGVSAQMDNPLMQAIPYRAAGYGRWEELLSRGELVHGHTQEFSEEEQRELREQDILSIVIVPIFVEGEWWGLIGFDECTSEREWSAAEIDALKAAADTLGAAIVRTRAERALRESEERFRATFDQAAVGVAHVSPHGSWLRVNEKLCEIVGYTREELLERTLQDITHPDDLEADLAYQGRLLAGEISRYSMEKRYLRKVGSVIWIGLTVSLVRTPSGEPKYFIVIVEDTTERKRAGEALVQSEERYRAVVEQAAEGIFLFEVATGDILESNVAFQELLGYTAQELLGMKLYDLVAHDREGIDRNIQRILDEGSRFVGERRYRCK
ncbi:MAG TPA: PAS domain S-box protein, partial [Rubrobacteraceae bacterium]|nr:PAS domain S-box protein [Rubrobacteraceae bacterium]